MLKLVQETPAITLNVTRYWLAWIAAYENYRHDFESMYLTATKTALTGMRDRPLGLADTMDLLRSKLNMALEAMHGSSQKMTEFHLEQMLDGYRAFLNSAWGTQGEDLTAFTDREAVAMEGVAFDFPKAIEDIRHEFGFQLDSDGYRLVEETDCFRMYQVLPTKEGVTVTEKGKPTLLVPPYMLGVHILAFLPGEGKSYAHAFANRGIPTYVRITKDIDVTPAVQTMSCEDDCLQTAALCAVLKDRHGRAVTLNGICQGGYISLINILSGKLDGLVDALITGVAPIDGTRSSSLGGSAQSQPADLGTHYAYDTLPNGNKVVNGEVMSLGFKLLALSREAPLVAMYNMKALHRSTGGNPGKTAAAINRWLREERVHLPPAIAEMSAETYKTPIAADGTLPVELFGEALNLHQLKRLGVRWYIGYCRYDNLVEMEAAIAAVPHLRDEGILEVAEFPGGHVGILTTFAGEQSKCPLDGEFNGMMGPVRFQLNLQQTLH